MTTLNFMPRWYHTAAPAGSCARRAGAGPSRRESGTGERPQGAAKGGEILHVGEKPRRERHALGGGEGGERRAVLLAEPGGDAPPRLPTRPAPRPRRRRTTPP